MKKARFAEAVLWCICALSLLCAPRVRAQEKPQQEFKVISMDNNRVYIDGGTSQGVEAGMKVMFFERAPSNGTRSKGASSLIPIGNAVVKRSGEYSSLVLVDTAIASLLRIDCIAIIESAYGKRMESTAVHIDTSVVALRDTQTIPTVSKSVLPPVTASVRSSLSASGAIDTVHHQEQGYVPAEHGFAHEPPASGTMYESMPVTLYAPEPMAKPTLYYRMSGNVDYAETLFVSRPNGYYYFEIPKEFVAEPAIEYYITVKAPDGHNVLACGNPQTPVIIPVSGFFINPELELARHKGNRNHVRVMAERVSFGHDDSYEHLELDYTYRVFTSLYSIRMGMGAFRGTGILPGISGAGSQSVNYYYGYTEAELKLFALDVSVIGRFLAGINNDGIGNGFEARTRFGDELAVNLVAAVWSTKRLGTSTYVQLNVPLTSKFGFSGTIALEDLPASGPNGFRMAIDLRYEVLPQIDVTVRSGVAARTAEDVRGNFGLGVSHDF